MKKRVRVNDEIVLKWVIINVVISAVVLLVINFVENYYQRKEAKYGSYC